MAFHIESEGKRLLIWADTCIHYVMSVERPEWQIDVDDDKDKAVRTRKRILDTWTWWRPISCSWLASTYHSPASVSWKNLQAATAGRQLVTS